MPIPRQLTTAIFFSIVTLARVAAAGDKETAKTLFEQGVAQMEAKSYDQACPAIEQSLKLDPYPGTLFALAECEALRGHPLAASARYGEYLRLYASLPRDKQLKQGTREKEARAKAAEQDRNVATATLTLPANAPAGTTVTRDGIALGESDLGALVRLEPGEHVVTTQAPGGPLTEQRFKLGKGEKREITLEVQSPSTSVTTTAPPPPPATGTSGRRVAAFVTGGVGLAGLVVGAVTGGLMLAQMDAIKSGCKDSGSGVALCNAEGASAGNNAKTFGTVATIGFAAGAVGAGVAIVLFATAPKPASAGAVLRPEVQVGVLSLGPAGTTVGVRGSF